MVTKNVQLIVTNLAGSDTLNTVLFVNTKPTGNFDFEIGNDGAVDFIGNVNNANSVSWDFGDGQMSSDLEPTNIYAEPGTYTVVLTMTNDCGDRTSTQTIEVLSVHTAEAFGDMVFSVFPNPTQGKFTVSIENANLSNQLSLELRDVQGRVIEYQKLQAISGNIQHTFNQPNLPSGVYFLKLSDQENSTVARIIVE